MSTVPVHYNSVLAVEGSKVLSMVTELAGKVFGAVMVPLIIGVSGIMLVLVLGYLAVRLVYHFVLGGAEGFPALMAAGQAAQDEAEAEQAVYDSAVEGIAGMDWSQYAGDDWDSDDGMDW